MEKYHVRFGASKRIQVESEEKQCYFGNTLNILLCHFQHRLSSFARQCQYDKNKRNDNIIFNEIFLFQYFHRPFCSMSAPLHSTVYD